MSRNIESFNNGLDVDSVVDALAEGNGEQVLKEFFAEAAGAEFLVPFGENERNLVLISVEDKGKMLPAFASYADFLKSPLPRDKAVILPFMKLDNIMNGSGGVIEGIVINPHGKSLTFKHKNGAPKINTPKPVKNEGEIRLSAAGNVPAELAAALSGFFRGSGKVYRAFFLMAEHKDDEAPHLFLLVDFDGKNEDFFPELAKAIQPFMQKNSHIEMAKADFKLLSVAEKLTKPFYKK